MEKRLWTQKKVVNCIIELEQKHNLLDGKSDNSKLWERMRFNIYREIMQKLNLEKEPIAKQHLRKQKISKIFLILWGLIVNSIKYNPFLILKKKNTCFIVIKDVD